MSAQKNKFDKIMQPKEPSVGAVSGGGGRRTGIGAKEATPTSRISQNAVRASGQKVPVTYKLPRDVIDLVDAVVREHRTQGYQVHKQDVVAEAIRGYWGNGVDESS
jgi:hypothetical protein